MNDVTYRLTDIVGKKVFAGKRGIYVYKVNSKGRRYRAGTIKPGGLIGKLKSYQILDAKQVGKKGETWVLFFEGSGFVFLPKGEKNLIDVTKFAAQGIKTDEQQIKENTEKFNASPIDAAVNSMQQTFKKYPAFIYIAGGIILYKLTQ